MAEPTYLERLGFELVTRLGQVPESQLAPIVKFLRTTQEADGGYAGREGPSDPYYTGFALRSLAILQAITPEIAGRAAEFLRRCLQHSASVVDLFSIVYSCGIVHTFEGPDVLAETAPNWRDILVNELQRYRSEDGGYTSTLGNRTGSTYHTFLVSMLHEMADRPIPEPERLVQFLEQRKRDDGGYVEVPQMKRSGTNPTAAAVGVRKILASHGVQAYDCDASVEAFLCALISDEGGMCANTRIPVADLLSTFTGFWSLKELGAFDQVDQFAGLAYLDALRTPAGGYLAGVWDQQADVEYTFYGLGTLALLQKAPEFPGH
jgi:geranylgeranyl transferase type-2 subunit beta